MFPFVFNVLIAPKTSGAILLRTVRFGGVSWPFSGWIMFK